MEVQNQLLEIGAYFKNKIISGDYEIISISECVASIEIDGTYSFDLWIANDPLVNFGVFFGVKSTCFFSEFLEFKDKEERVKAWEKLNPIIKQKKKERLERQIIEIKEELKIN